MANLSKTKMLQHPIRNRGKGRNKFVSRWDWHSKAKSLVVAIRIIFKCSPYRGRIEDFIYSVEIRGTCLNFVGKKHENLEVGEISSRD